MDKKKEPLSVKITLRGKKKSLVGKKWPKSTVKRNR